MTSIAQSERAALSDLFVEVGPDAPTLCEGWTTRDLAAHLVIRERSPLGGAGIVVSAFAGFTDKAMAREAGREWDDLVQRVRSGPAWFGRPVDKLINTIEYFVHHEDVRRATEPWEPRDDPGLDATLWSNLLRGARFMTRSLKGVGLDLVRPDGTTIHAREGEPTARVVGPPGELVLYIYGRRDHARVELEGDAAAVDAVQAASFGV